MSETNFNGVACPGLERNGSARSGAARLHHRGESPDSLTGMARRGMARSCSARTGGAWLHHRGESPDSFHRQGKAWRGKARQGMAGLGYIIAPSGATVYLN